MAKSAQHTKPRGRRATGRDRVYAIRLPSDLVAAIEDWARANGYWDRSSAIRAMIKSSLGRERIRRFLEIDDGPRWDERRAMIASQGIERGAESD
jgi:Arc/MetJ-type ribon-helix-helix transcriptional regulator